MEMNLKKYVLTSPKIDGKVVFGFDGQLLRTLEQKGLRQGQLEGLLSMLPCTEERLKEIVAGKSGAKLQMIPPDLSFGAFWDAYKKKVNKLRCEPLWQKLSEVERMECIMSLPGYESFLRRDGRAKRDPDRYLKEKSWQNKWDSL